MYATSLPAHTRYIQHHLENLAFATLQEEDLARHSDEAVIKAFRLAQLTIEYLLTVQVRLDFFLFFLLKRSRSRDSSGSSTSICSRTPSPANSIGLQPSTSRGCGGRRSSRSP